MQIRLWGAVCAAAFFVGVACTASAHTPPAGSPLAAREHPRLWLTTANLPALRAKLAGDFRSEYQAFIHEIDGRMNAPKNWFDWERDVLNFAFVHQVGPIAGVTYGHPATAYGQRARQILLQAPADGVTDATLNVPLAYDWLYTLLTPGERTTVVNFLKQVRDGTEGSGGNPYNGSDVQLRSIHILAGLAFWGDGIDDAAADRMVNKYATLIEGPGGTLGAGSFFSGTDGGWSMGLSYSTNSGTGVSTPRVMEGWRTANGLTRAQVFGAPSANVFRYYPVWVAYHILPPTRACASCPGGYEFPVYRSHATDAGLTADGLLGADFAAILAAHRLYKGIDPGVAGLSQWLMDNRTKPLSTAGYAAQAHAVFSHFITGEKNVTPRSPSDLSLPLSKLFTNSGWAVMRTGWGAPTDTVVTLMASPWARAAGSYTNYNQGSFTIDRRGPLAINAGSGIHHHFAHQTYAYNTMIFPDPAEPSKGDWWDLGGQRLLFPQLYNTTQLTPGSKHDLGGIRRFLAGTGFDYVFADVTRAYNGPAVTDGINTAKVSSFTRQLVYLRPEAPGGSDRIVVFDRALTTDPRFEKRWLLHPSASGSNIAVNGTGTAVRAGRTEYSGADLVTATNTASGSNGRLFSRTLLPASRKIVVIGGPGHEYENPYGVNENQEATTVDPQYGGTHRVEVIPAVRSTYDTFLHVLEATDATTATPTPTRLLTGTGMVAAKVGQTIVAFNQNEGVLSSGDIVIDTAGTYRVVIGDLTPGASHDVGGVTRTASSAGTIDAQVSAAAGVRLTVRQSGAAPVGPPAAPTGVRIFRSTP